MLDLVHFKLAKILQKMEYIVAFYQDVETSERLYKTGEIIRVNQESMFDWVEKAQTEKIKICIYTCSQITHKHY